MLSLEQVKLLNTKVERAIEYVRQLNEENAVLKTKLENNQKRLDELEVLITRFKEEQGRIEDGILSALDRLNQFETAVEKSLAMRTGERKPPKEGKSGKLASGKAGKPVPDQSAQDSDIKPESNNQDGEEPDPAPEMVALPETDIDEGQEDSGEALELDIF
jgi:chromosome segregation ATPase